MISTMNAIAGQTRFYIGTYTNKTGSKGIYTATIDSDTGRLGPVTLAAEAVSPNFLALAPGGKYLYAATETGGGSAAAFKAGPDGLLTLLNESPAGAGTCHVWCDGTGANVLVANYNGGSIACFHTKPDGSLGERTASIVFSGSGPNPGRQKEPHGHSIYTDDSNRFAYACDLGTDNVWAFKFDAGKGTLTPNDPPVAKVPPGAGPRHLAFHPGGKFAYVCNEMGLSVTAFKRDADTGSLTPFQTLSTVPPEVPATAGSVSEICCHPDGKRLYVSNRRHDSIAVYSIAADGKLTWLQDMPAQVQIPRGFAVDPTGRWLIVAGQKDNRIAVLKIDLGTGKLSATDQTAPVGAPVCIIFASASN